MNMNELQKNPNIQNLNNEADLNSSVLQATPESRINSYIDGWIAPGEHYRLRIYYTLVDDPSNSQDLLSIRGTIMSDNGNYNSRNTSSTNTITVKANGSVIHSVSPNPSYDTRPANQEDDVWNYSNIAIPHQGNGASIELYWSFNGNLSDWNPDGSISGTIIGTPKKFTVTYDANTGAWSDGATKKQQEVTYGNNATPPSANPSRTGYNFSGWNNNGQNITASKTISANWTPKKYTVTYNGNGGTYNGNTTWSNTATYDTKYQVEKNFFSRQGYTFNSNTSWSSSQGKWVPGQAYDWIYDYSPILKAEWTLDTYKITYNLNGGIVSSSNPTTYNIESNITLNNPTKVGYTFVGWSGTGLSGNSNKQVKIFGLIGNREYTANWIANTGTEYTVIHKYMNVYGGYDGVGDIEEKLTGTTGTLVTPNTKPQKGFTTPAGQEIVIQGDGLSSVTYKYIRNQYKVTLDPQGGIISEPDWTSGKSFFYQAKVNLPTPTKENHLKFMGWFTLASGGTQINSPVIIADKNITYYAHWQSQNQKITYIHSIPRGFIQPSDWPSDNPNFIYGDNLKLPSMNDVEPLVKSQQKQQFFNKNGEIVDTKIQYQYIKSQLIHWTAQDGNTYKPATSLTITQDYTFTPTWQSSSVTSHDLFDVPNVQEVHIPESISKNNGSLSITLDSNYPEGITKELIFNNNIQITYSALKNQWISEDKVLKLTGGESTSVEFKAHNFYPVYDNIAVDTSSNVNGRIDGWDISREGYTLLGFSLNKDAQQPQWNYVFDLRDNPFANLNFNNNINPVEQSNGKLKITLYAVWQKVDNNKGNIFLFDGKKWIPVGGASGGSYAPIIHTHLGRDIIYNDGDYQAIIEQVTWPIIYNEEV